MDKMRQWSMLTAIGVVAVLAAGWFLLVSPQRSHASDLHQQAGSQLASNSQLRSQIAQLEQQKKGLPAQQRLLSQISEKVPDNPALPALIRELSVAADKAGVELVSIAPAAPQTVAAPAATTPATASSAAASSTGSSTATSSSTSTATGATAPAAHPAAPLEQIAVAVNVTGSYFNVEQFFANVEKMQRAMLVTGWTIAPATSDTSAASASSGAAPAPGTDDTLTATLTTSVFESPVTTAPASAAPVAPSAAQN